MVICDVGTIDTCEMLEPFNVSKKKKKETTECDNKIFMCGQPYQDTIHADRANLIMRYLSIRWSDLETEYTIATVRISRSFL